MNFVALFMLAVAPAVSMTRQLDIAYGDHAAQRLDLYAPKDTAVAPVMVYVHGGSWQRGDKAGVGKKASFFTSKGWVFVSVNYRLLPEGRHPRNVEDVAAALAWVHDHVTEYGGAADALFLIGHSAGCHLAALVATEARPLEKAGKSLSILRGVIALDTNAYDLPLLMDSPTARFYQPVFGDDPDGWRDASPRHHVGAGKGIPPFLVFYSRGMRAAFNPMRRTQAEGFVQALNAAGIHAEVVDASDRGHGEINRRFGDPEDATVTVKAMAFLEALRAPANKEKGPAN